MNNEENREHDLCENRVIKNSTDFIDNYYDSLPDQLKHQKLHRPNCQLTGKYHWFSLISYLRIQV